MDEHVVTGDRTIEDSKSMGSLLFIVEIKSRL